MDELQAGMFASPWRHRELVIAMIRRQVLGRYRGSVAGMLWAVLNPIFLLSIYTLVFSSLYTGRWTADDSNATFALIVFAGFLVFNLFSECVNEAPALVVSNVNYVKKVLFPLEILPWVSLGAALFHTFAGLAVWLAFHLCVAGWPPVTALASLGVFLRDIGQLVVVLTTALMFLSAIFYPPTALPVAWQQWLFLNPLALFIEQARAALIMGQLPSMRAWGAELIASTSIAWLGFIWFQKTRKGFADVL
jgi:lipopolysaccharide transport system permease protein